MIEILRVLPKCILSEWSASQVMKEDTNEVKSILIETGHLGLRDLLYGEPSLNNVKTLSYCMIYSIDLASFNDIMQEDEDLMELVINDRRNLRTRIRRLNNIFLKTQASRDQKERKPSEIPSWIIFPDDPKFANEWCSYGEYEEGFEDTTAGKIARQGWVQTGLFFSRK